MYGRRDADDGVVNRPPLVRRVGTLQSLHCQRRNILGSCSFGVVKEPSWLHGFERGAKGFRFALSEIEIISYPHALIGLIAYYFTPITQKIQVRAIKVDSSTITLNK